MAAIHGIDLDKELGNDVKSTPSKKQQSNFVFGDPAEYEKLSEEDRIAQTQKMMNKHKDWAGNLNIPI